MPALPLSAYRVVDLSTGIAGGYCGKFLADAGADVLKAEPPEGDALRRWSASHSVIPSGEDGALFQFLACSKRSVVFDPDDAHDVAAVRELVLASDAVLWSPGSRLAEVPELAAATLH